MLRTLFTLHLPWISEPVPIFAYPFFLSLGILLGTLLSIICSRRYPKLNARMLCRIALYTAIGGYLGARIWFILVYAPKDFTIGEWLEVWNGGLAIQGGIIGGLLTVMLYCSIMKVPLLQILDVFAAGAALGNFFARIGCFLNGCCWGRICSEDFPLAVRFPGMDSGVNHYYIAHPEILRQSMFKAGIKEAFVSPPFPVHPVQLYTAAGVLAITAFIAYLAWSRIFAPGTAILIFLFCYSLNRFIWEFFRDDSGYIGALHPGQITAAAFMLISAGLLLALRTYYNRQAKSDATQPLTELNSSE